MRRFPAHQMVRTAWLRRTGVSGNREKPDIDAQEVESTKKGRVFRDLDLNPPPAIVLMTSSSELP
jgi:hypothetical protein